MEYANVKMVLIYYQKVINKLKLVFNKGLFFDIKQKKCINKCSNEFFENQDQKICIQNSFIINNNYKQ